MWTIEYTFYSNVTSPAPTLEHCHPYSRKPALICSAKPKSALCDDVGFCHTKIITIVFERIACFLDAALPLTSKVAIRLSVGL